MCPKKKCSSREIYFFLSFFSRGWSDKKVRQKISCDNIFFVFCVFSFPLVSSVFFFVRCSGALFHTDARFNVFSVDTVCAVFVFCCYQNLCGDALLPFARLYWSCHLMRWCDCYTHSEWNLQQFFYSLLLSLSVGYNFFSFSLSLFSLYLIST